MRLLLDTHALLWFLTDDARLSRTAHALVVAPSAEVWVSAASLWEIVIKSSLGKLPLPRPFAELIPPQLEKEQIQVLPIRVEHLEVLERLPFHHRDPFDRLLLAQAVAERLTLISRDEAFAAYEVQTAW